jgi:hypothetical protein
MAISNPEFKTSWRTHESNTFISGMARLAVS